MKHKLVIIFLFSVCTSFAQFIPHAYSYNVDNFPDVFGGKSEWKRFLHDHMIYPTEELAKKTEGKVQIFFIVTKEGKGINPKIGKSVSPAIDKEAMRLFNMLEWLPSSQNGTAVDVDHSVEINFSVSKYKKWVKERGYDKLAFTDIPSDTSFAVHESADKGPSFTNPDKTYAEFIYSNLEYPEMASRQGLEGNLAMSFIVEPDGHVSNIRIQNAGIGGGCNEEAIRVIGLTTWKPAKKNNMYVRYRMYYTMVFSIKNSFKDNSGGTQRNGGQ